MIKTILGLGEPITQTPNQKYTIRSKIVKGLSLGGAGILLGAIFVFLPTSIQRSHNSILPHASFASVSADGSDNVNSPEGLSAPAPETAQDTTKTTDAEFASLLEGVLKVVYIILWPLLYIAGLAMDNSLIYGEVFHLDKALFTLWQMMRNFANFAIGLLFLRKVIQFIINTKSGKAANPINIVIKLLIAGVLVQMSWFIMGALVDVSTVLTAGVGGLPLNLIGQHLEKKPIFGIKTSIKLSSRVATNDNVLVLYTLPGSPKLSPIATDSYLLPCYITGNALVRDQETLKAKFKLKDDQGIMGITRKNIQQDYCIRGQNVIAKSQIDGEIPIESTDIKGKLAESQNKFLTEYCPEGSSDCLFLDNLAKKGEGMQSAFYSLYASLLGLSNLHVEIPQTNTALTMSALIRIIIAMAYLIPLAVLCVVLIMRIGYLRIIIAFSPIIALTSAKDVFPFLKGNSIDFLMKGKKFNFTTIIELLMLPVVVTFTLSLSIVLLSSLSQGLSQNDTTTSLGISSHSEPPYKCYNIFITEICIDQKQEAVASEVTDYFSWILLNILGVGLMRFAVMAALKSSELTKGFVDKIDKLATNAFQSAPVIPLPGLTNSGFTSIGGLKAAKDKLDSDLSNAQYTSANFAREAIEGTMQNVTGKDNKAEEAAKTALTALQQSAGSGASGNGKQIIDAVNSYINSPALSNPNLKVTGNQIQGNLDIFNTLKQTLGVAGPAFNSVDEVFDKGDARGAELFAKLTVLAEQNNQSLNVNAAIKAKTTGRAITQDEEEDLENRKAIVQGQVATMKAKLGPIYSVVGTQLNIQKQKLNGAGAYTTSAPSSITTKEDLTKAIDLFNSRQIPAGGNSSTPISEIGGATRDQFEAALAATKVTDTTQNTTYSVNKNPATGSTGGLATYKLVTTPTTP